MTDDIIERLRKKAWDVEDRGPESLSPYPVCKLEDAEAAVREVQAAMGVEMSRLAQELGRAQGELEASGWPGVIAGWRAENARLRERIVKADEILMRYQRGESGLPFEPAGKVVRPALEALRAWDLAGEESP